MRVLVCGGRKYSDQLNLFTTLDEFHKIHTITHLIEGGANGADSLARTWAILRKVPFTTFPADWQKHGNAAGSIRNQQMLDEGNPGEIIAFAGGHGTANMIKLARIAGVRVSDLRYIND